jgi:1-acyl-sn-glycerol-3-phosphate acyltransferase
MIRTIFVWSCIVIDTLVLSPLAMIIYLFDRSGRTGHGVARLWARVIVWASGVKVKTEGLEHVRGEGPYLFMSNHQGAYDIFALESHLPFQFKWLAKKELFFVPVLGWAMAAVGYISIDREGTRKTVRAMNEAARKIQEGMSLIIFPEGSRSPNGSIQPFKKGGFTLAIKSKAPIIPIAITGSRGIMPKEKLTITSGEIRIRIDHPIGTQNYFLKDRKLLMEKVQQTISKNFELISGKLREEET